MNVASRQFPGDPTPREPYAEIGNFRRFGPKGPVYEVISVGEKRADGDWEMRIRMPESGEEADYPFSQLRQDPLEV